MSGKYAISCFGGSSEGVGKGILFVVVKCLAADTDAIGNFNVTQETRDVLLCTIDWSLDAWRVRWNIDNTGLL